jgi:MFS family permease
MTLGGRALPLTIATAFLMEGIDSSVVATALPNMARDLGTSIPALAVSVTAYLISLAAFMPLGGWLADRFGGRKVFTSALGVFAAGSLLCGVAPDSAALILGRVVQGMGGAMMAPVGRAILLNSVPKADYVRVMNYVIMPALIGPAAGPLVGGFLSTYVSWHWIFLINLPLAAIGIAMAIRFIPSGVAETPAEARPFDWVGYGCLVTCLCLGQAAIEMFGHGAAGPLAGLAAVLSAGSGLLFVRRFRRLGSGILDLSLLRIRTLRLSITAGSVARVGLGGAPILLPLLLQIGVGAIIIKPATSFGLRRLGCRGLILANSVLTALGLLGFLVFRERSLLWLISPYAFVFGLLRSVQMTAMNALSYADVEKPAMARASTMSTLAQRLSMGVGVNVAALALTLGSHGHRPDLDAFAIAFAVTAALVLVAGAMFLELAPTDGWQVSNRPGDGRVTAEPRVAAR